MPLGAAIALCGWRGPWALVAPALLTFSVETAQIWIPGRDASLGDLVFNTTGAAVGLAIVLSSAWWLRPGRGARRLLMLGALAGALGVFAATGMLLQQDLPRSTYWGQWTPQLGHLEWYRGRIVRATLGMVGVPDGELRNSDSVRALLMARAPLAIHGVAGPPVPALGSLLSIADDRSREIMLLGPERDALVLRRRTRAAAWLLAQPNLRADGALRGVAEGESLDVVVRADGNGYCFVVNGRASCGLGFTLGRGWSLVSFPERMPSWFRVLLDDTWLAGLLVPLGFWLTGRRIGGLAVIAAFAGLWLVPGLTGLLPTSPGELAGAAVGIALGLLWRWRLAVARPAE